MENLKEKYRNLSAKTLSFTSFIISICYLHQYFKKNYMLKEFYGHFNSPQNIQNRSGMIHHLKEAILRGGIIFIGSYFILITIKFKLIGFDKLTDEMYRKEEKERVNKLLEKKKSHRLIIVESDFDDNISINPKRFDVSKDREKRDKVDKYLN